MLDATKIGKRIQDTRKARGLTQSDLAAKVDITPKYLSNIECGDGIPILIVRPKAMLTKNYVNVPPEIEQEFLAAFGNYATPLGFVSDRVEASRNPSRGSDIRIRNHGKIYSVQMGELWENHFANYYFWNEPRHAYYFP
ncbi:hypothetical protein B5G40_15670 [Flavonifractor sp. An9]|nr:hypothetical protein B5G40_15670 [Flavonifractor sp. An9]